MKKFLIVSLSLVFLPLYASAQMQNLAASGASRLQEGIFEQQKDAQIRQAQQTYQQNKKIVKEESALTEAEKQQANEKVLKINKIFFAPSTVLNPKLFENLKNKYEDQVLSVNDIYDIVNTINASYLIKGYIAARAYLPQQDVSKGLLVVSLMEGRIDKFTISNNKHTKESYIKRYIDFCPCDVIQADTLQKGVLEFNAANDAKARLTLEPGQVYGTTNVNVVMEEPPMFSLAGFMDNAGQKETGLLRYGAFGTVRSLTKYRDILSLGGMMSEGSHSAFGSYEIPEPFFNARVGVSFDYSDTKIINGDLKPLNITGDFYGVSLYAKKPFFVKVNTISNVKFTASTKKGANYIDKNKTQSNDIDTLSLSLDNILMFNRGYIFNMISATDGLDLIGGDNFFFSGNYYGEGQYNLSRFFGLNLKVKGQKKLSGEVPSSEQMQIGGVNTVRGYREGMLSADNAIDGMFEFQYNMPFFKKYRFVDYTQTFAFFDYGKIFPSNHIYIPEGYDKDIYSTGVGLRVGLLKHFDGTVSVARTLKAHKYFDKEETKVLFYVQAKI